MASPSADPEATLANRLRERAKAHGGSLSALLDEAAVFVAARSPASVLPGEQEAYPLATAQRRLRALQDHSDVSGAMRFELGDIADALMLADLRVVYVKQPAEKPPGGDAASTEVMTALRKLQADANAVIGRLLADGRWPLMTDGHAQDLEAIKQSEQAARAVLTLPSAPQPRWTPIAERAPVSGDLIGGYTEEGRWAVFQFVDGDSTRWNMWEPEITHVLTDEVRPEPPPFMTRPDGEA